MLRKNLTEQHEHRSNRKANENKYIEKRSQAKSYEKEQRDKRANANKHKGKRQSTEINNPNAYNKVQRMEGNEKLKHTELINLSEESEQEEQLMQEWHQEEHDMAGMMQKPMKIGGLTKENIAKIYPTTSKVKDSITYSIYAEEITKDEIYKKESYKKLSSRIKSS